MGSEANGNNDGDCLFLERVLDKLYDFGSGPKQKSHKKKKRKRCEEEEVEEDLPLVRDVCSDTEDYRAERDGAEQQQQQPKAAQTGPAIRQVNQVEVVTFQDPTKKRNTQSAPSPNKIPALQITEREQSDQLGELSLEKARLEVHRFGITGYRKEQQRVFEQDRAVMLGARPPKKEYVNYKVLQEQIKKQKEKVKEEAQLGLKKKKKSKQRNKKTTLPSGPGAAPSGQLGRFKNGMLILNSKEIQKIKGSK
ncbi:uncharacterized protein C1orf131 [Archocentrus centrarchus]|uniref:uncharacterized protein C1orf131 n=1 Tax=Archocentrus centrarchus TaxID=63155 RepID=UPI0011EA00B2|nr:uncharacterized protein C1orf131 homolog [Archocentrus centrarchus]